MMSRQIESLHPKRIQMLEIIVPGVTGVATGAAICYLWTKNVAKNRLSYIEKEATAKAKAIEKETEL